MFAFFDARVLKMGSPNGYQRNTERSSKWTPETWGQKDVFNR